MKTELEKKLNKLPPFIIIGDEQYDLKIYKDLKSWHIDYVDCYDNCYLGTEHNSLQAAVDTTLREIKNL